MSLAPTHEAIRRETSGKPLLREKPAKFWGTGYQCKDDYCHQLSVIFESVETLIRIMGLYLGVVPLTCIPVLSILWLFYSIIYCLMCFDTFSLNCIQFPLWTQIDSFVWNEIVHGISSDISGWYHQYNAYSTPMIKGNAKLFTRISWCCLFFYFISELWGDGLWACPQLCSYSWWGCE
jgi:hypothetical protein